MTIIVETDEKDRSCDFKYLFMNISARETTNYILDGIYDHHKLKQMFSKVILLNWLLLKYC